MKANLAILIATVFSLSAQAGESEVSLAAHASTGGLGASGEMAAHSDRKGTEFRMSLGRIGKQVVGGAEIMVIPEQQDSEGTWLAAQAGGGVTPQSGTFGIGAGVLVLKNDGRMYAFGQLSDHLSTRELAGGFGPGTILGIEKKLTDLLEVGGRLEASIFKISDDDYARSGFGGRFELSGYAQLRHKTKFLKARLAVEHERGKIVRYLVPKEKDAGTAPSARFSNTDVTGTVSAGFAF